LAIAVCESDGVFGWPVAVLLPVPSAVGAWVMEISDLGFTGGLGLAVLLLATTTGWEAGACLLGSDGLAAGSDFGRGWDFLTVCACGTAVFSSGCMRIFLRTIFGVAGSLAGWSQPSRTIKKQIKQVKLQMIIRFFFMMFQLIFEKDDNL
jgi:hypothetical protein